MAAFDVVRENFATCSGRSDELYCLNGIVHAFTLVRDEDGNLQVDVGILVDGDAAPCIHICGGEFYAKKLQDGAASSSAIIRLLPKLKNRRVGGGTLVPRDELNKKETPAGVYYQLTRGESLEIEVKGVTDGEFWRRIDLLSYDGITVTLKEGEKELTGRTKSTSPKSRRARNVRRKNREKNGRRPHPNTR